MQGIGHCSHGSLFCRLCVAGMASLTVLFLFAGTLASDLTICVVEEENFLPASQDAIAGERGEKVIYTDGQAVDVTFVRHVVGRFQFAWLSLTGCDTLNSSCAGVVIMASCEHSEYMRSWATKHVIPYVRIPTHSTCAMTTSYLNGSAIPPRADHRMLQELLVYQRWTQVAVIVDSRGVVGLLKELSDVYLGSVVFRLFEEDDDEVPVTFRKTLEEKIEDHLSTIQSSDLFNILVIASKVNASLILQQAEKMGLLTRDHNWIIALPSSLSSDLLGQIHVKDNNILVVQPLPHDVKASSMAYLHIRNKCYYSSSTDKLKAKESSIAVENLVRATLEIGYAERANTTTTTTTTNERSSLCENSTDALRRRTAITKALDEVIEIQGKELLGVNGEMKTLNTSRVHDAPVYSICRSEISHPEKLVQVGMWSQHSGLTFDVGPVFQDPVKIGTQEAKPFVQKIANSSRFEGFCIDILDELAQALNFTYELVEPTDKQWGAPKDNLGNWTGIVQQVLKKEVEFGIGPFTITSIREEVIDFTKPFMEDGVGILTKRPDSGAKNMFKMFTPLTPAVWGAVAGAVALVSASLYLIERSSPFSARNLEGDKRLGILGCIWLIYGSYMEQGGEPHPRSVSARCLVGCWWLFTILMSSTYTANLAAFLTVTIYENPVNSLTDLAASPTLMPLAKQGSNVKTLFEKAEGGDVYQDIWGKMAGMPDVRNNEQALQYVLEGSYAYMTDASQLEYILMKDCTAYSMAKDVFNTGGFGFVLREHSPYMEAFNYNIMKMQEAGLMDKWRQRWWSSPGSCLASGPTSAAKELDWPSLSGLFYIFLGIAAVSVLLRLLEFWLHGDKLLHFWNRLKCKARQATSGDNAAASAASASTTPCICSSASEASIRTQCTTCSASYASIAHTSSSRRVHTSQSNNSTFDCPDSRSTGLCADDEAAEVDRFRREAGGDIERIDTVFDNSITSSARRPPFQDFDSGSRYYWKTGAERNDNK